MGKVVRWAVDDVWFLGIQEDENEWSNSTVFTIKAEQSNINWEFAYSNIFLCLMHKELHKDLQNNFPNALHRLSTIAHNSLVK